jgi:hypothetical protein
MFAARGGFNYVPVTGRTARTLTATNQAQVSTAESKFGGASARFDGSGDYVTMTANSAVTFGTADFTWEFWFSTVNKPTSGNGRFPVMLKNNGASTFSATNNWIGIYDRHQNINNTKLSVFCPVFYSGNGSVALLTSTSSVTNNTWTHVAVVRENGDFKLFYNGNLEATRTGTSWINIDTASGTTTFRDMRIGMGDAVNDNSYNGYIDELRISSIARYSANFTPATSAFSNDSSTLLLMHADGTNGSTVFTDDNS